MLRNFPLHLAVIAIATNLAGWHDVGTVAAQSVEFAQGLPGGPGEIRIPVRDKDGNIVPMKPPPAAKKAAPKQAPAKAAIRPKKPAKAEKPKPAKKPNRKPAKKPTKVKKPVPKKQPAPARQPVLLTTARVCEATRTRPGEIWVENLTDRARPAGPATFGLPFRRGLVRDSVAVAGLPSQTDAKRRWSDGSLKHAVLTVMVPEIAAKGRHKIALRPASGTSDPQSIASWDDLAGQLPPVTVRMRIHNGPTIQSALQRAEPQGAAQIWLRGRHVVEHLRRDAPTDETGKADPDIEVRYHVRHYPASGATRVAVIVENTKWTAPGNVAYDVDIRIDGKPVFERENAGAWPKKNFVGHAKGARWIRRFWINRNLSDLHVRYPIACLLETGLLPHYDPAILVAERSLLKFDKLWNRSNRDILQNGQITPYFPTTGARYEIGPLPTWTALYLLSQDPRVWAATRGNGEHSGSVNIHLRDPNTDRPLSLDDYPEFSLNARGSGMKAPIRDISTTPWVLKRKSHFTPDNAHQGSFAYVPYLLTGDYFFFEEMAFWANYNMLSMHRRYRGGADGLLYANQIRGVAWALRNLAHVAALAPETSWARTYFERRLSNNLAQFNQHSRRADRSPIGVYKAGYAYTRGWNREWKARYLSMPPWQQNFLIWSVSHVIDLGYPEAEPFLSYLSQLPIGLATTPNEITPHAASAYFLFVAENVDQKRIWARSLKDVDYLTYEAPSPKSRSRPEKTSMKGYTVILRAALAEAARAGLPNARKAFQWLANQQGLKPKAYFAHDPTWALSPDSYPKTVLD